LETERLGLGVANRLRRQQVGNPTSLVANRSKRQQVGNLVILEKLFVLHLRSKRQQVGNIFSKATGWKRSLIA